MRGVNHGVRIAAIWVVASIIVDLLIGIIPIPSPVGSSEALGEHQTLYMLFYVGAPIFVFVWVLLVYNLIVFRSRPDVSADDVPDRPDSNPILLIWAGLSFIIVLFLAGWGTFTLHEITAAPSAPVTVAHAQRHGQSTKTVSTSKPASIMDVQVIGQQWQWTFRYPSYGGMETNYLELPVETPVRFNITSLDVVHSFWIYDYDVKEDAVPGVSNEAYFLARMTGSTTPDGHNIVVCNELCGLWHGNMHADLKVVSQSAFTKWARAQEAFERKVGFLKALPPYATVYWAQPVWPPAPQDQSP
ncbi:MAG: cytochrome c oxidase subunit II [Chloroflexota bacterium]